MIKKILTAVLIAVIFAGLPANCAKKQQEEIITSQEHLNKRQYQTRDFSAGDKALIMKAVLNTLQDEGFIVYNANYLLGFIYGEKDFDTSDPETDISKEFGLSKSRLSLNGIKVATMEVSANATEYNNLLKLRVNFKRKLLNTYGNAQFIDDVTEEEFYRDFYEKLDRAIFLLKQKV